MFEDGVAVGHAGEVVADGAEPAGPTGALLAGDANFPGMFQVIGEKVAQHGAGAVVWLKDDGAGIEILQKVGAEFEVQTAAAKAVLDQGMGLKADVVGGLDAGGEDGGFGGLDDVAHLAVNEAADDEVAAGFVGEAGVFGQDGAGGFGK